MIQAIIKIQKLSMKIYVFLLLIWRKQKKTHFGLPCSKKDAIYGAVTVGKYGLILLI